MIACPATNRLLWVPPAGELVRAWQAPGSGDCWHLNSLVSVEGRLAVCAFGRFGTAREWAADEGAATGVVFDFESGRTLISGLSRPHHPRFVDGFWVVCNSARNELLRIDPVTGTVDNRLALAGWTRGLCVLDDYLLAGESSLRRASPKATASVAVICRKSWRVLKRIHEIGRASCRERV